jgi:hypothetical protein
MLKFVIDLVIQSIRLLQQSFSIYDVIAVIFFNKFSKLRYLMFQFSDLPIVIFSNIYIVYAPVSRFCCQERQLIVSYD